MKEAADGFFMMDKLVWFFFIRRLFFGENEIAVRVPSLLKLLVKEVSFKLLRNTFSYSTSITSSNSLCLHVFFRSWTLFTSSSSSALFSGALKIIIIMPRPSFLCPSFLSLPHCTPLKRWVRPEKALLSVTRFQRSCVLVPFKIFFFSFQQYVMLHDMVAAHSVVRVSVCRGNKGMFSSLIMTRS